MPDKMLIKVQKRQKKSNHKLLTKGEYCEIKARQDLFSKRKIIQIIFQSKTLGNFRNTLGGGFNNLLRHMFLPFKEPYPGL